MPFLPGLPMIAPTGLNNNPNCPCPPTVIDNGLVLGGESDQVLTSATTNNFTFTGLANTAKLLLTTQGDLDAVLTGIDTTGLPDGFMLWVQNVDSTPNTITLSHADVLSLAPNRFYLPGENDLVLAQNAGTWLSKTDSLNGGVGGWLAIEG